MVSKSFAVKKVGELLIYVHGHKPPTDAEWDSVIQHYAEATPQQQIRTLVYTEGAAPNAAQRARLTVAMGARRVRIAVLTPSPLARAAGTAVSWFRPEVRVFGPNDLQAALAHLAVSAEGSSEVGRALDELKAGLGIATPRTSR